jgi:BphX-like
MKQLQLWMRVVGAINLLLGIANVVFVLASPASYADNLPFAGQNVGQAFADAWLAFALDLLVVGVFLLWAANRPQRSINVVWLVIWLEVFHGIVDDCYLIARGFSAGQYAGFIVLHLAIIVTGTLAARAATAEERLAVPHPVSTN